MRSVTPVSKRNSLLVRPWVEVTAPAAVAAVHRPESGRAEQPVMQAIVQQCASGVAADGAFAEVFEAVFGPRLNCHCFASSVLWDAGCPQTAWIAGSQLSPLH